jgi:F-type H+-transporting ATPase subunit epsilon
MRLKIITPKHVVVDVEAEEVYLPGPLGELGIWQGHAPLVSTVLPGIVTYLGRDAGLLVVQAGFVEVLDDTVTILVGTAERECAIDRQRSERELEKMCCRDDDPCCGEEERERRERRKHLLRVRIEAAGSPPPTVPK